MIKNNYMKNYMKKIIVGILTFVFLFTGIQSVFASGPFNGQSGDCYPGIGIGVYPGNIQKDGYGCWSATSITANAGDTINIAMYYHNNTSSPLTNVSGSISKSSSGPSTSYTFTGRMYSDQGSTTVGTVSLNLTSSQTLTYSSTHWMKDAAAIQSDTDTSVFHNDGGQISIGTVPAGWSDYGEFLVVYKVSNTVAPQVCQDTSATNYGGSLPCTYPAQVCKDTSATNYGGTLPCTYPAQVCKDTSATNYGGTLPCTYPAQVCKDTSATNYGGSLPCTYPAQVCKDTSATNYGGSLPCTYPQAICTISRFDASPTSIKTGGYSTLYWATQNCDSVTISNLGYNVPTSGTYGQIIYPASTTTYVLTAYGNGGPKTSSTTVTVAPVDTYTITAIASTGGTITPPGVTTYKYNDSQSYSVVPNTGYHLVSVSIDGVSVGTVNSYGFYKAFTYIQSNHTISAVFALDQQLCKDTSANNYNGALPCTYPAQVCKDTSATNYGGSLPCTYPAQVCKDTSATNYGGTLPCTYPAQVCKDTSATNYGGSLPCTYPQVVCSISNFSANPTLITSGGSSTLSWGTSNCTSATIYPILGSVNTSGSSSVSPAASTTYTLTAYGASGAAQTRTVIVSVNQIVNNCLINSFSANPTTITSGGSSTLSWGTSNCTSATIYPILGSVNTSGSSSVSPTASTTYTLTAYGASGAAQTRTVIVSVNQIQLCKDPTATNYNGTLPCTYPQLCKDTSASNYNGALPCKYPPQLCKDTTALNYNGSLPCQYPQLCKDPTATNYNGALPCNYLQLCKDTTALNYNGASPCQYPQLCKDTSASNYNGALPCKYPPQLCKDTTALNYNGALPCQYPQLCKDVNAVNYYGALPCQYPQLCKDTSASNYNGALPCQYPQRLCKDTTALNYNGALPCQYPQLCKDTSASNYNGALPCQYPPQLCKDPNASNYYGNLPCQYPPQLCQDHNATNYRGSLPCRYPIVERYCQDPNASNYRGTLPCDYPVRICQDPNASNYRGTLPCDYPVRICQDPNAINYRGSLPCDYSLRICQDSYATNYRGSLPCYYPQPVQRYCQDTSASNYLGTLPCEYPVRVCQDPNASNYRGYLPCTYPQQQYYCQDPSATNYRGTLPCNYVVYVNKNVVTTVATNISKNEAQINGYITNTSYYNSNVYFNYGTTVNMGSRTASRNTSGSSTFNDVLRGLAPNTIYFFQAVGEVNGIESKGSIEIFRTLAEAAPAPIIIQGTTVIGTASPVELLISNKSQLISAGDLVDYVVTYKNIGKSALIKPMVQVVLPTNTTLVNSSRGTYSVDTHTLSAPVEDLAPGQEGAIYLQAKVDSIPLNNAQIVTTAILVYTSSTGAQENAMTYVINIPSAIAGASVENTDTSLLGGSAFFGGLLSIGLVGWLLIVLVVMIIILISRSYNKGGTQVVTHTPTH